MKKILTFVFFNVILISLCKAQISSSNDSLELKFNAETDLQTKYKTANKLFNNYKFTDKAKSEYYFKKLYQIAIKLNKPNLWSDYYRTSATVADRDNNFSKSVEMANIAINYSLKITDSDKNFHQKASYMLLANIYIRKEKLDLGMPILFKADSVQCDNSTLKPEFFISQIFTTIYLQQEDSRKALESSLKTLSLAKRLNLEQQIIGSYAAVGSAYYFLNDYISCLKYCDSAKTLMEKAKRQYVYEKQGIFGQLAQCHFSLKDYVNATTYYHNQLEVLNKMNDTELIIQTQYHILDCYLETGKAKDTILYFMKSSLAPTPTGNVAHSIIETYLHTRYKAFKRIGENEAALRELELLAMFKDSSHLAENKKNIYEIEIKYETAQKEKIIAEQQLSINKSKLATIELKKNLQLAALNIEYEAKQNEAKSAKEKQKIQFEEEIKRREIISRAEIAKNQVISASILKDKEISDQKLKLSQRRNTIFGVTALAAFFLMAGILMFSRYHSNKKSNILLAAKNNKIETLIQELQHRTKNNLQVVSSLLSLQSTKTQNNEARNILEEGKNRIDAMSLIHQKLYTNDGIASVDFKDYAELLISHLVHSYRNVAAPEIKLTTAIEQVNLNIDLAVPLGLILNELITNALKYGLGSSSPELLVCLKQKPDNNIQLIIKDNGPGFTKDAGQQSTLGLKLVHALIKQVNGNIEIINHNGMEFVISVSKIASNV